MKFSIYNEYMAYKPVILEFERIMETTDGTPKDA
jgi:hypothetical protein